MNSKGIIRSIIFWVGLIIAPNTVFSQTLDGKNVYLYKSEPYIKCKTDSVVYNKRLMANDTFSTCDFGKTNIYYETKNKRYYGSQVLLTHTVHFINGKKFNEYQINIWSDDPRYCCGERIFRNYSRYPRYYFQDCEIGSSEYISNLSYNESRDTLTATVEVYSKTPTIYLQLMCTPSSGSSFECVLMMNDHSILNRFALEGCEIELNDLQEGKYDSRIANLQSRKK